MELPIHFTGLINAIVEWSWTQVVEAPGNAAGVSRKAAGEPGYAIRKS